MSAAPQPSFVIEIEQEVLGTLLTGGDFRRISGILETKHFIEPLHGTLFSIMKSAFERYNSTTVPVVARLIPDDVAMAFRIKLEVNVNAYLAKLAAGAVYGGKMIEQSARKIVEQWARIALADEAGRLHAAASDPHSSPLDLVANAGQVFDDILSGIRRGPARKSRVLLSDAADNAFAAATEARERGAGLTGMTWGLTDLNRLTGGMQRRDLTLIGARPSMGKTTFAVSCGISAAKAGHGVGLLSLEMDRDKIAARAVCDMAYDWGVRVPYVDLIRGNVSEADIESIRSATKDIKRLPLWIDDQSGITIADVRVKIEAMTKAGEESGFGLSILMIDHLGLIRASSRYSGNRNNEIAEMTGALKSLAREYDIAVVLLSQLNRSLEQRQDKRPQLSDLRDSGAIEQDADTIMFLHREAYYLERTKAVSAEAEADRVGKLIDHQNKLEVEVAKQRNGPIKRIDVFADMACAAIRNAAVQR